VTQPRRTGLCYLSFPPGLRGGKLSDPAARGRRWPAPGPRCPAVEILDFDNLKQGEGAAQQGGPTLAELLADKQTANLRLASLDQYMHFERNRALRRPDRINLHVQRVFHRIGELLASTKEDQQRPA
jgi:hypothetical protein